MPESAALSFGRGAQDCAINDARHWAGHRGLPRLANCTIVASGKAMCPWRLGVYAFYARGTTGGRASGSRSRAASVSTASGASARRLESQPAGLSRGGVACLARDPCGTRGPLVRDTGPGSIAGLDYKRAPAFTLVNDEIHRLGQLQLVGRHGIINDCGRQFHRHLILPPGPRPPIFECALCRPADRSNLKSCTWSRWSQWPDQAETEVRPASGILVLAM